jgi:hypothetical protein
MEMIKKPHTGLEVFRLSLGCMVPSQTRERKTDRHYGSRLGCSPVSLSSRFKLSLYFR